MTRRLNRQKFQLTSTFLIRLPTSLKIMKTTLSKLRWTSSMTRCLICTKSARVTLLPMCSQFRDSVVKCQNLKNLKTFIIRPINSIKQLMVKIKKINRINLIKIAQILTQWVIPLSKSKRKAKLHSQSYQVLKWSSMATLRLETCMIWTLKVVFSERDHMSLQFRVSKINIKITKLTHLMRYKTYRTRL